MLHNNDSFPGTTVLSADRSFSSLQSTSSQMSLIMSDRGAPHIEEHSVVAHLPLSNISFHSPSAILGTPLDPTSRFEYPFPTPESPNDVARRPASTSIQSISLIPPQAQVSQPSKSTPYLHPRHIPQEPPVPPSLAKKRRYFDLHIPLSRNSFHDAIKGKSNRKEKTEGNTSVKK